MYQPTHQHNISVKAPTSYKHLLTSVAGMANDSRHVTITTPISGHGTSVAPRLRPKPAHQHSTTPSLGLTLPTIPLNPSPKNIISPVPAANIECDKFVVNFNDKFLGASVPRYSPNATGRDSASFKFTTPSTAVSPATLLSPFEQETMSTSTSASIRPRPIALTHSQHRILSNSNSEKSLVSPLSGSFTWNPFEDPSPFSPISTLTEDQIFGEEFDKLRLEGSQTSIVTSPEDMQSDRSASYWGASHRESLSQALSIGIMVSNEGTQNGKRLQLVDEDPFESAPFTLPKRLKPKSSSSKLASKLSDRWRHAVGSGQGGKESLIENTPTDVCSNGIDERPGSSAQKETVGLEKSTLIGGGPKNLMLDDLITSGEKGSPSFIKLPIDDRNKYEKLNSNGITSDDSDSEYYPESMGSICGGTENPGSVGGNVACAKKHSFKQFVESNIPEKLQAVYHKVDKSQIKNVQIVKKLRNKVVAHAAKEVSAPIKSSTKLSKGRRKSKKNGQLDGTNARDTENATDDDSIGSASDLRANDDFLEGDEIDVRAPANGLARKKLSLNKVFGGEGSVDDCISESIKTCGSSAYHAECESVTTNEDNTSRIVTRVRVKKREHFDSKHSVIDEDVTVEEDMIQGEKPLLLDDELDYESAAENNTSGEEILIDPFCPEEKVESIKNKPHECLEDDSEADAELDPFAMAPFRKPLVVKRSSITKFMPEVHPIPEHFPTGSGGGSEYLRSDFLTSTMKQTTERELLPKCNEIFELLEDRFMPLPEPIVTSPLRDKSPNFCQFLFGSESTSIMPTLIMSSSPALVTGPKVEIPSSQNQQPTKPFVHASNQPKRTTCTVTPPHDSLVTLVPTDTGLVTLTPIIPQNTTPAESMSTAKPPLPICASSSSSCSSVALINQSKQIACNTYQQYDNLAGGQQALSARRNYINFSQIPSHNIACISPDQNYVNFVPHNENDDDVRNLKSDDYDDNSGDTVVKVSSKGFLPKKQKVKYNHLDDTNIRCGDSNHGRDEVIDSKLGHKVKANVGGYRKVVSEAGGIGKSKKEESFSKPPKNSSKSSSKVMGFSNMSFEDFPSDEQADELGTADATRLTTGTTGSGKLVKMTPFEVIRNEKMLMEAEKKFGSLKRRSNPFS